MYDISYLCQILTKLERVDTRQWKSSIWNFTENRRLESLLYVRTDG